VEGLVERGRSSWYVRDGVFCLALAGLFAVLQLVVLLPGWAEGLLFPFGFCAVGCAAIGLVQVGVGQRAWCCSACGVGLHPDRVLRVSGPARPLVRSALAAEDAAAIVAAVAAHPYGGEKRWWQLHLERCPRCGRVARVHLEDDPGWVAMAGDDVAHLIDVAEVDLPG
jgi:hypothetical protein